MVKIESIIKEETSSGSNIAHFDKFKTIKHLRELLIAQKWYPILCMS